MKTIILLVSNLDGLIDSTTVKMINYRNSNNKKITNTDIIHFVINYNILY